MKKIIGNEFTLFLKNDGFEEKQVQKKSKKIKIDEKLLKHLNLFKVIMKESLF